jgi:hypothetical protein
MLGEFGQFVSRQIDGGASARPRRHCPGALSSGSVTQSTGAIGSAARVGAGRRPGAGAGVGAGSSNPGGSSDSGVSCPSAGIPTPASSSAANPIRETLFREVIKRDHLLHADRLLLGAARREEHDSSYQHEEDDNEHDKETGHEKVRELRMRGPFARDPPSLYSPPTMLQAHAHDWPWKGKPIVLVGLMGAGKTTVGRRLAQRMRLPFVDADHEIEAAAGMTISDIFERFGEPYFRDGERRVIARLIDGTPKVIATGGGAFLNDGDPRADPRSGDRDLARCRARGARRPRPPPRHPPAAARPRSRGNPHRIGGDKKSFLCARADPGSEHSGSARRHRR